MDIPDRKCALTPQQENRVEDFIACPRSPVMVISYEMLLRSVDALKKLEFGLVICDEGHRLKNSNIKTASALTALACDRRVILTGQSHTPTSSLDFLTLRCFMWHSYLTRSD